MAISQYKIHGSPAGANAASDIDTVQRFPLGYPADGVKVASASNDLAGYAKFVYAQGSNIASAGQFCHIQNGSAVLLASANSASYFPIGVACAALTATSQFGWVQVGGLVDYAKGTNSAVAAGVPMYLGATAGQLASNVAIGSKVEGVVVPVSYTSSQSQSFTVVLMGAQFVKGLTAAQ